MPTVRLTETRVPGLYHGSDGRVYARVAGAEARCDQCRRWTQVVFRRCRERVCGRHVRVIDRTRIRVTTTFACRVYRTGETGVPPATVVRRGDTLAVGGPPAAEGRFDKFVLPAQAGYVLVPRSRWAWAFQWSGR